MASGGMSALTDLKKKVFRVKTKLLSDKLFSSRVQLEIQSLPREFIDNVPLSFTIIFQKTFSFVSIKV